MGGTQSSYSVQVSNRLSNQASHIGQLSAASRLHASAVESQLSRDAEKGQLPVVYWEESSIKELGLSGRGGHGLATFVELGLPDGQQVRLIDGVIVSHTLCKQGLGCWQTGCAAYAQMKSADEQPTLYSMSPMMLGAGAFGPQAVSHST